MVKDFDIGPPILLSCMTRSILRWWGKKTDTLRHWSFSVSNCSLTYLPTYVRSTVHKIILLNSLLPRNHSSIGGTRPVGNASGSLCALCSFCVLYFYFFCAAVVPVLWEEVLGSSGESLTDEKFRPHLTVALIPVVCSEPTFRQAPSDQPQR